MHTPHPSIPMRLDDAVRGDINKVIHWVGFYVSSVKTLCVRFVGGRNKLVVK